MSEPRTDAGCDAVLQQIAENNPAGLSDEFVNAFRAGWRLSKEAAVIRSLPGSPKEEK